MPAAGYISTPYMVELYRNGPAAGQRTQVVSLLVPDAGAWNLTEIEYLLEGAYSYDLIVTDAGNGRVSRVSLITVNLKR